MKTLIIFFGLCALMYGVWKIFRLTRCTHNSQQAKEILNRHCIALTGKQASTSSIKKHRQPKFSYTAAWVENTKPADPFSNPRYLAYLRAYLEIAEDKFYGSGIPLKDGKYLLADKGVMKILLEQNLLELNADKFFLTEKGAQFVVSNNN